MPKSKRTSEADLLETYRIAMDNVRNQKEISKAMAEIGYDEPTLDVGRKLLNQTLEKYSANQAKHAQRSDSFDHFAKLRDQLEAIYSRHRKIVRVIFRNEPAILELLKINQIAPRAFVKWTQTVKSFYEVLAKNTDLQARVLKLKITEDDIIDGLDRIKKLQKARSVYLKQKGESQHATTVKDDAFSKLDTWMSDFFALAKIALEDTPQLQEALNRKVKS